MRNILITVLLPFAAFGVLGLASSNVHAAEHNSRIEVLGHTDIGDHAAMYARYLHDNETGQEIVCITAMTHTDGVMSCYPTGRIWK